MHRLFLKLVSGGPTGADRAALDFALAHGIPQGGYCPVGRSAEDGPMEGRYQLEETPESSHRQRDEWNVRDSDGRRVFAIAAELNGGSRETVRCAEQQKKPVLHLCRQGGTPEPKRQLRRFLSEHRIRVLNLAGPRASQEPAVGAFVRQVLEKDLAPAYVSQRLVRPSAVARVGRLFRPAARARL